VTLPISVSQVARITGVSHLDQISHFFKKKNYVTPILLLATSSHPHLLFFPCYRTVYIFLPPIPKLPIPHRVSHRFLTKKKTEPQSNSQTTLVVLPCRTVENKMRLWKEAAQCSACSIQKVG
jgi:hypothetical protein